MTYPVVLAEPSRLFVMAHATYSRTDPGPNNAAIQVTLDRAEEPAPTALSQGTSIIVGPGQRAVLTTGGVLRSNGGDETRGFTIPAGSYVLRLQMVVFGSSCAGAGTFSELALSHIVLGAG